MLAFIVKVASGQTTGVGTTFEMESGWIGSNITSTASGDMHIGQSKGLSFSYIMSSHNGVLKITDTLATINELIKSYKILDSLLKRTQFDYYEQQQRNYNMNKNIQRIIKQGRSNLKKMKLIKTN